MKIVDHNEATLLEFVNEPQQVGKHQLVIDLGKLKIGRYSLVMETENCRVVRSIGVDK